MLNDRYFSCPVIYMDTILCAILLIGTSTMFDIMKAIH